MIGMAFTAPMETGTYLHWGIINISLTNVLIIVAMVIVFVVALVLPFGRAQSEEAPSPESLQLQGAGRGVPNTSATAQRSAGAETSSWTVHLRSRISGIVPPGQALPDRQPAYVASWIYVFGVLTIAALFVVVLTGAGLAIGGSTWWHVSSLGHVVNSLHLWSVELFFVFMVIHLWGKFWMAAWRGRRAMTWITGVLSFALSIATAFTGYLSQSNFDSQWIGTQAKDGLNSIGFGAWFNVLNPGQMLMWHILLLPGVVGLLVVVHVVLVRRHGVVPPLDAQDVVPALDTEDGE